jgi:DNA-3-methyladenine glycosylase II
MPVPFPRGFDLDAASAHLARRDRKLGRWIARIGVLDTSGWRKPFDTVDSLARSILYQQLSGKAAATIVGRLETAVGTTRFTPEAFARVDDAALRACGVSGNKALALRDLGRRAEAGEVPDAKALLHLHHEEIIERLTAVRGIGRWTVEMMLMFRLGRPDILPVDDFGVRNGFRLAYGLRKMPQPRVLAIYGERWKPYRTAAAWYLWRAVDLSRRGQLPEPAERVRLPRAPRRRRRARSKVP